jgi:hypothetical protein
LNPKCKLRACLQPAISPAVEEGICGIRDSVRSAQRSAPRFFCCVVTESLLKPSPNDTEFLYQRSVASSRIHDRSAMSKRKSTATTVSRASKKKSPALPSLLPKRRRKRGSGLSPASLANLKPFPPGQSGNPGGRPKTEPITHRYRMLAELPLPEARRKHLGLPKGATYGDALCLAQLDEAIEGSTSAAREIGDRLEGKPKQRLELTGEDGEPVEIANVRAKLFDKLGL